jgi:NAD(P)-dependent dehydrogenase (short-subunit alcohol dehydrogenase family)
MARLNGYACIITGAGAGIGRAVVRRFMAEGANVVAVIRKESDRAALEAEGACVVVGDVSHYDTAERAVAASMENYGKLDVYIANAGLWDFHKRVEKQSPQELENAFDEIFSVNVKAALYGGRAAVHALRQSGGTLIVTGSNASFLAGGGGALYTASKFALRGLMMQLAKEFAPEVRVNGVAPGATDTGISGPSALGQHEKEMNADSDRIAAMAQHMLLGRISQPEDHAALYVLLASKTESPYVTGTMLLSDGGLTISV